MNGIVCVLLTGRGLPVEIVAPDLGATELAGTLSLMADHKMTMLDYDRGRLIKRIVCKAYSLSERIAVITVNVQGQHCYDRKSHQGNGF